MFTLHYLSPVYYCVHHVWCIMYSSCFYGLYSYINCMMITVSMFLPLYSSCMMNHVFMACIHSFIHSGNNTCVFVHDFINESKLSLSLSRSPFVYPYPGVFIPRCLHDLMVQYPWWLQNLSLSLLFFSFSLSLSPCSEEVKCVMNTWWWIHLVAGTMYAATP